MVDISLNDFYISMQKLSIGMCIDGSKNESHSVLSKAADVFTAALPLSERHVPSFDRFSVSCIYFTNAHGRCTVAHVKLTRRPLVGHRPCHCFHPAQHSTRQALPRSHPPSHANFLSNHNQSLPHLD